MKVYNSTTLQSIPSYIKVDTGKIWSIVIARTKISAKSELGLIIVGEQKIRTLNKVYRSKDCVTDVLSFPTDDSVYKGDIYICWKRLSAQARFMKHSERQEFRVLALHGMLHVLGYDHVRSSEYKIMHSLENKILSLL